MWSAFEQYRAEFFLKRAYLLGQRRLRDIQPRRGGAERPALPDGEKILELTQSRQMKLPSAVRSTSKSRKRPPLPHRIEIRGIAPSASRLRSALNGLTAALLGLTK
jgi:hypothetical protein